MNSVQFLMECLLIESYEDELRQVLNKTREGLDSVSNHIKELNQQKQQLQTELHRSADSGHQASIRQQIGGIDDMLMSQYALRKSYEHTIHTNEAKLRLKEEFLRNHPKVA
jgi:phage shock protein A